LATFEEADSLYSEHLTTAPGEWHARTLIGIGRTLADRGDDDGRAERTLREGIAKIAMPKDRISSLRVEARAALAEVLWRTAMCRGESACCARPKPKKTPRAARFPQI
jgi:hypothetical protein